MADDRPGGTSADLNPANLRDQPSDDALVGRSVTIGRPRATLYAFWRDPANLAPIMESIERIEPLESRRSRWTVKGPTGDLEWVSEIVEDIPGERIAWQAEADSDIRHRGWIEFRDGPTGRGTEVHALIEYDAPGGALGRLIAKVLQREPNVQARRELRRFKQLMETGEITRSDGPHGKRAGFPKL